MSKIRLHGTSSGYTDIAPTAAAGNNTLTAPTGAGTLVAEDSSGNITISDGVVHTGDTNTKIRFPAADTITAETAGTEWFRITSAGSVGMGNRTSNPDANLHVHTSSGESTIHVEGATNANLNLRSHSGDSTVKFSDAAASNVGNINYDHGTDKLSFRVNASDRFVISSAGKISIGGASNDPPGTPDGNLHIQDGSAGSVTADTAGNLAVFEDSASNGISILVPAAERANIYFGTPGTGGQIEAGIQYAHESVSTAADRRDMIFRVGGGEKVRFQGTGGISFNGDSAAENALDDYEEGTFTPTATVEGESAASTDKNYGRYVKVGNKVTVWCYVQLNGTPSNRANNKAWQHGGLPFTHRNVTSGFDVAGSILHWTLDSNSGLTGTAPYTLVPRLFNNATSGRIRAVGSDANQTGTNASLLMKDNTEYSYTFTYETA